MQPSVGLEGDFNFKKEYNFIELSSWEFECLEYNPPRSHIQKLQIPFIPLL